MKSSIGQLRERLTVLVPAQKKDRIGGYTVSWAKKWSVWAHIMPQINSTPSEDCKGWKKAFYKIRVRSGIGLKASMRIRWQDKLLKIATEPIINLTKDSIEFSAFEIKKGSSDDE